MLSIVEFSVINAIRCNVSFHPLNKWSLEQYACAVAGETGEMCNLVKKTFRGENPEVTKDMIAEEIADIVTYCDLLMTYMGYSLESELIKKFNKVSTKRNCDVLIKE